MNWDKKKWTTGGGFTLSAKLGRTLCVVLCDTKSGRCVAKVWTRKGKPEMVTDAPNPEAGQRRCQAYINRRNLSERTPGAWGAKNTPKDTRRRG